MNNANNFIHWFIYLSLIILATTFVITLGMCLAMIIGMLADLYTPDITYLRNTTFTCIASLIILLIQDIYHERRTLKRINQTS